MRQRAAGRKAGRDQERLQARCEEQRRGDGQATLRTDAKRPPWRPGSRGRRYGDGSSKEKRGMERGAHNGADGVLGEAGDGPERRW